MIYRRIASADQILDIECAARKAAPVDLIEISRWVHDWFEHSVYIRVDLPPNPSKDIAIGPAILLSGDGGDQIESSMGDGGKGAIVLATASAGTGTVTL